MTRRQIESWAVVAFVAVTAQVALFFTAGLAGALLPVVAVGICALALRLWTHPRVIWWTWVALRWSSLCRACGLLREEDRPARAWWTADDHAARIRVRVPAGMSAPEVIDLAPRVAACLRGVRSWATWVDEHRVELHVVMRDALASIRPARVEVAHGLSRWGRDEGGCDLVWAPAAGHTAIQGSTGSGKSSTLYSLLAPLAGRRDVRVVGSDVSGLVLEPWRTGPGDLIACGGHDLEAHALALEGVVEVMTARLADLVAAGRDSIRCDEGMPWIVVVLEEAPALLAATRTDRALHLRVTTAIRRIKQEGRKVGIVSITTAQRMTAAVMDADARAQEAVRITHRVDTSEALRLLHDGSHLPDVAEVRQWPPGLALVEMPGRRLTRARADLMRYADYRAAVARRVPVNPLVPALPEPTTSTPDDPPRARRSQPKRPRAAVVVPEVIEASG